METFCGIGLPEIIILVLVSFVFIGPERSRSLALTLGRWLRRLITSTWWREFNQVANSLRDLPNTLVRMSELEDSLRQMQTDITQATQIDLNLHMPTVPPTPGITMPPESSPSAPPPPDTEAPAQPVPEVLNEPVNLHTPVEEIPEASVTPVETQEVPADPVELQGIAADPILPSEQPVDPPTLPEAGDPHDN